MQKYTCGNSQLHRSCGRWGLEAGGSRHGETCFFWRAWRRATVSHQPAGQHRELVYTPGDKLRPTHSDLSCFSALPHDIHALSLVWRRDSELRLQRCIFASINQENRIAPGTRFNLLSRVLRHGADDLKRISNRAFQKTNRYLKGMITKVCSVMLNLLWFEIGFQKKKRKKFNTTFAVLQFWEGELCLTYWPLPQPPSGTM